MLTHFRIQNVLLIENLNLNFSDGLSALTGETGAGKSILLDSLSLALGGRSSSGLVRQGADQGVITAVFDLNTKHAAFPILKEQGVEVDGDLILKRIVTADGKSKAFINDQPISIGLLKSVGDTLVEIQGQFEQHGLMDSSTHIDLLDAFAGLQDKKLSVQTAYDAWREAERALNQAETDLAQQKQNEDFLRHCVDELQKMAPQPGEEQELADKRSRLQNQEKILGALTETYELLTADTGAEQSVNRSIRTLSRITAHAGEKGQRIHTQLEQGFTLLQEASYELQSLITELSEGDQNIDQIEERLFALRALARKHQITVDELAAFLDDLKSKLSLLDRSEDHLKALRKNAAETKEKYHQLAIALSDDRKKAAVKLDKAVMAELAPLKLEKATFKTVLVQRELTRWARDGIDAVEFMISTNPGTPLAPLAKSASGGELSRFLLALKVILSKVDPVPTLVFDEVDSGVGGAVAEAVGDRLSKLGDNLQVLVVTHSPQVAAKADAHLKVEKQSSKNQTITSVTPLDAKARQEEIARMLSGATVTDEARAQATRLMAG